MNGLIFKYPFSEDERRILTERIFALLGRQTTKYLAGDSSSAPVETVEELLRSLAFTLRLALDEGGKSERELLSCDLWELLTEGQRVLQEKLGDAKALWEQACVTLPPIPSEYLKDSLGDLGAYLRRYDLWYFAHRSPDSAGYPLCVPVPENIQGVACAGSWLRRLLTEYRLLERFPCGAVTELLAAEAADFWNYPINLCEQPVINAVGLAMLGKPAAGLKISVGECAEIEAILCCGEPEGLLDSAAARASAELGLAEDEEIYLREIISEARPRLRAALCSGNIGRFFLL